MVKVRILGVMVVALTLGAGAINAQENLNDNLAQPTQVASQDLAVRNWAMPTVQAPPGIIPPAGFRFEMSFAPPINNIPTDPYQMGKYGRLSVDYTRITRFDGGDMGVMIQAMHVAHHLLLYSAGFTSDINNDGRFLLTAGLAHYQTGNAPTEPFVDAPFIRLRMQSLDEEDPAVLFVYSDVETTMHFRSYISGTAGLGLRVSPLLRLIGGFQHTEFVMPTEQTIRIVNGLQGILQWGM